MPYQKDVICHGGLYDGRRWPMPAKGPEYLPRILELLVPQEPVPVGAPLDEPPMTVRYACCRYQLARGVFDGRLIYVPMDFYIRREQGENDA